MPAKMDEIMKIAKVMDIPVLEDAAEALGSELEWAEIRYALENYCTSFNGNKMITTRVVVLCVAKRKRKLNLQSFMPHRFRMQPALSCTHILVITIP